MDYRRGGTGPGCCEPEGFRRSWPKNAAPRGIGSPFAREGVFMSKLLIQSGTPDAAGCVLNITPESAGWRHIGFQVHRLAPRQVVRGGTGERETCLVVLAGTADIVVDGERFDDIG